VGAIYRHALARFRGQVLGWGLALALLGWPIVASYEVFKREQENIARIAREFEGIVTAMGGDVNHLGSPVNYFSMRYFAHLPLILGIFAVLAGSGLLVSDEESGTLDLILAHPVSRADLFFGRWLAWLTALLAILLLAWLGLLLPMARSPALDLRPGQTLWPYLSLLGELLFFGDLALLCSMVLPSRRLAASAAGLVLVASFFLTMLARVNKGLAPLARFSPLEYYQSGEALNGLNGAWLAGLVALAGLFVGLAWWGFERRDVRVAGEGGWRWPVPG
jgi:ABC-2 type transport system permease protein